MRLDTESLRTLKTTIASGSLTIAAQQLSMTTSAVSWKLKRLENRIGRKLIQRQGHKIEPTSAAQELLEYAEVILTAHDRAVQQFRLSDLKGRVIIGITDDLASNQLPAFIHRFHQQYPDVRIEIRVEQQLTLLTWFDERLIDLAILPLEDSMIETTDHRLWQDELIWVKSRDRDYSLSEDIPLVTFSPSCTYREVAISCLQNAGISFYVSMESPSLAGVRGIVSSGMGVTLINRGLMTEDQCEWKESESFFEPRLVSFIIRRRPEMPPGLSDQILAEVTEFFNEPKRHSVVG
ncbi:MAG: DNA-binding transcriptional LysR family regulator [Gammaproteobacteria bacterium]|jgi:DNA-binding transcriptional LysR family regulator